MADFEAIFELEDTDKIDCIFDISATVYNYEELDKLPQINGETLIGNKTSEELHLASAEELAGLSSALDFEIQARETADVNINNRIDTIVESFDNDIERLEQNIQNETTTRANNDTLLQNNINTLDEKVDGININLTVQIDNLEQDVNDKYNELIRDIDDLTGVVEEDYNTLNTKIDTTATTINQRITDVADELNQTIEENVVALQQEDTALQNQINAHSTTLTAYDTRITNNANVISQEITNRQNADDNLQEQIDTKQPAGDYATKTELTNGLVTKQDTLVSGTNIKTLNNESLLGSGNIDITSAQWGNITGELSNQTDLKNALDGKQPIGDYATNTALTNGLATKQDVITDLGDIRNNIATNTSNISYLDEKVRDIELFKFPNAVIIGEPTISNGQVSGFSTSSYLQFPFILDLRNQAFQIDFSFTTATNVQTQQNILDSNFGLALAIANGKGLMAISSNGTSWDIGSATGSINIQSNTTYYARLTWNRLQYKTQLSTDGVNYTDDMVIVDTRSPYPRTMFIGGCDQLETGHAPHPFLGTINMNKVTLSVMGNVIWQGMDDAGLSTRADLSLSNLDELGEKRFTDLQTAINTKANNSDLTAHTSNGTIHVTASDKIAWSNKQPAGDYATNTALTNGLATKQDTISDLDAIREGASKGATALQSVPSNYVTDTQLATKQNLLIEGDNITIENDVISAKASGGLEVGDIGLSIFVDESKGLRRYLNGSIVAINTNTQAFLDRLKQVATLYPSIACTESEWQTIKTMSVHGQCGKFVIDEANGTIRLPRIVMPIQGLTDLTKLGEIVEQGLPNIKSTSTASITSLSNNPITAPTGALQVTRGDGTWSRATGSTSHYYFFIDFNASRSSSIYKDGSNVQQEQVQYPYFIQIATGQETQVDIVNTIELNNPFSLGDSKYSPSELDNISWLASKGQDNSGDTYKAFYETYVSKIGQPFGAGYVKSSTDSYTDYDLVINTTDKTFRLPLLDGSEDLVSDRKDDLTLQSGGSSYTAPANGWFRLSTNARSSTTFTYNAMYSNRGIATSAKGTASEWTAISYLPAKKGDIITVFYGTTVSEYTAFIFTYAKGNGTLYFYVGETVQNANLIDAGRIAEQLTNKVDVDSSWGFPSNRYIDLTLGASGSSYTAPANGWVMFKKSSNAVNQFVYLNSHNIESRVYSVGTQEDLEVYIPITKNITFTVHYSAGGNTESFKFIYAEGAN